MTKILVALAIALCLTVVACTPAKENTAPVEWKHYENPKFNVSFDYPSSLQLSQEQDYSDTPGIINPGYDAAFLSTDRKTRLVLSISLSEINHTDNYSAEAEAQEFYKILITRKPQPYDEPGEKFASLETINGAPFVKWGIVNGSYSYITYAPKKYYQLSLVKSGVYDGSKIIGYEPSVVSDADFQRIIESFTFAK